MTRLELKNALIWEGKISGNTEAIAQLNTIISDAVVFIGQSHDELLLMQSETYDIDSENPTPIVQALGVDRVELFNPSETGLREPCTIPEEGKLVGPAPLPGWPKCYSVEGNAGSATVGPKGLSVRLSGGASLDVGIDQFTVWWKMIPIIGDDADTIPDAWVGYLKKECLSRIALQRAKDEAEISKGYTVGADQRLKAHVGTDQQSTSATN